MGHTIRVDQEVADELYRRRLPRERNHNGVIRRAIEEAGMHLMVCTDGVEIATVPLRDGDDPFNREAERGALDRAYEAKESNPDAVVSVVIVADDTVSDDAAFVAEALLLLADLDEGENTDQSRLRTIAYAIKDGLKREYVGLGERVGGPGDPRNDGVGAILHPDLAENFGDDPFATVSYVVQCLVAAALAPEHRDIVSGRQVVQLRRMGQWVRCEEGRPV